MINKIIVKQKLKYNPKD